MSKKNITQHDIWVIFFHFGIYRLSINRNMDYKRPFSINFRFVLKPSIMTTPKAKTHAMIVIMLFIAMAYPMAIIDIIAANAKINITIFALFTKYLSSKKNSYCPNYIFSEKDKKLVYVI